jgi:hypothetical protein
MKLTSGVFLGALAAGSLIGVVACAASATSAPKKVRIQSSFLAMDDAALTKAADLVVAGEVASVGAAVRAPAVTPQRQAAMLAGGLTAKEVALAVKGQANRLYTPYAVTVSKVLKGSAGLSITVYVLGGSSGDLVVHADGYPSFSPGEKVLLFLEKSWDGRLHPIGVYRLNGDIGVARDLGQDRQESLSQVEQNVQKHK